MRFIGCEGLEKRHLIVLTFRFLINCSCFLLMIGLREDFLKLGDSFFLILVKLKFIILLLILFCKLKKLTIINNTNVILNKY